MLILSAEEMRTADRVTTERYGVPSLSLMEEAGHAVARFVLREFAGRSRVTALCGRGNNGGDGFVAARILHETGLDVRVVLLGTAAEVKGDAKAMLQRLPVQPFEVGPEDLEQDSEELAEIFSSTELFLDAVVGTGFRPPLRGAAQTLRGMLLGHPAPVVAVDLPSGWDADSREFSAEGAYRADAVVTFTAPKLAHAFGCMTRGPVVVAPIGSPEPAVVSSTGLTWAGSSKRIAEARRDPESNKGRFGHVLVVGGSRGKSGAPSMSALAALRAGAGLVTAAVPQGVLTTVSLVTPELMTIPLLENEAGEASPANLEEKRLKALVEKKTVLAVGPGISSESEAAEFVRGLVRATDAPLVLDADGLNAFAGRVEELNGQGGRTVVLTPHPGEMARLLGVTVKDVQADRENLARRFAIRHAVTLVLKGWRTLIAHPDGRIAVSTTGNPGMAKGGSGDILTGIVAAMLAQFAGSAAEAVEAAVYLHGLAADFALRRQDEHTLLATDTVASLHEAFRFRAHDEGGYVWLQGIPSEPKHPSAAERIPSSK